MNHQPKLYEDFGQRRDEKKIQVKTFLSVWGETGSLCDRPHTCAPRLSQICISMDVAVGHSKETVEKCCKCILEVVKITGIAKRSIFRILYGVLKM